MSVVTKRITPDEVVDAYRKTSMGVANGEYIILGDRPCGCGMGVYAVANLGVPIASEGDEFLDALMEAGIAGDYHDGFALGFDGDRYTAAEFSRKREDWRLGYEDGKAAYAAAKEALLPPDSNRKGFTLPELLVAMAITAMMLVLLAKFAPRWWADFWMSKGAQGVHAQVIESRSAAANQSAKPQRVVGFRLLPDDQWELVKLADGTIDRTRPIGYARTVPLVEAGPYASGLVSVHTDGWPAGFIPAYGRLVLEQSPVDEDGHRSEPPTWWWMIRVGDVLTLGAHEYTVCGPTLVPVGPENPDGLVNWGWPGTVANPLDRGFGPAEWLYLTNRADDDGDGATDEGWNGLDDDLDGYTDEDDEWEVERWRAVPPEGLVASRYSIARRPTPLDARSGGDVANDKLKPSPVVVDGRKSVLPVNPLSGVVDVVFDSLGRCSTPTIYGVDWTPPLGVTRLYFWVAQRGDVATTPDADAPAKVVSLDMRTGQASTADADPTDVAGTLARIEGR